VYIISKGVIKIANKKFARNSNSDYEMHLNSDAEVTYVGDDASIDTQHFNFCPISQLGTSYHQVDDLVDVLGIVTSVGPLADIVSKTTNKQLKKRVLTITDQDSKSVELTVWGDDAIKYNEQTLADYPVLAIKNAKISKYGGVSLSTTFSGEIRLNPDRSEAHQLKAWWNTTGMGSELQSLTQRQAGGPANFANAPRKMLSAVKDENLGHSENPDFFTVRGFITWFIHDPERKPFYLACPSTEPRCNKKVSEDGQGQYHCAKCNKTYTECNPRYILSMICSDATGTEWLTAFDDVAKTILGIDASKLKNMLDSGDNQTYEHIFQKANFSQWVFRVRAKSELVQDAMRVKCTIERAALVDFVAESRSLLEEIHKFS